MRAKSNVNRYDILPLDVPSNDVNELSTSANEKGRTLLHYYAKHPPEFYIHYIKQTLNISSQDSKGLTPLHLAIKHENYSFAEGLLSFGAHILKDKFGLLPTDYYKGNKTSTLPRRLKNLIQHIPAYDVAIRIWEPLMSLPSLGKNMSELLAFFERMDQIVKTLGIPLKKLLSYRYPWFKAIYYFIFKDPFISNFMVRDFPGCREDGSLIIPAEEELIYSNFTSYCRACADYSRVFFYQVPYRVLGTKDKTFYDSHSYPQYIFPHLKKNLYDTYGSAFKCNLTEPYFADDSSKLRFQHANATQFVRYFNNLSLHLGLYTAEGHTVGFLAFYSHSKQETLLVLTFNTGDTSHLSKLRKGLHYHKSKAIHHFEILFNDLQTAPDDHNCTLYAWHFVKTCMLLIQREESIFGDIWSALHEPPARRRHLKKIFYQLRDEIKQECYELYIDRNITFREEYHREYFRKMRWDLGSDHWSEWAQKIDPPQELVGVDTLDPQIRSSL